MAIHYETLKNWSIPDQVSRYDDRDCMLYALGLGYGQDPLDASELPFVFERDLRIAPSLYTVIGAPGAWASDPGTGIDWTQILHGEHRMTVLATPAARGSLRSVTRVARIVDKGPGRGALVITERAISDDVTGRLLATIDHTSFCRADGGIGRSDDAPVALQPAPETPPHKSFVMPTPPSAALLYRLNGDRNPIHVDPQAAKAAGFDRPILHGLCTFGMACRAVLKMCCDNEPARLATFSVRFSAPFTPGDALRVDIWQDGESIRFQGVCASTNKRVLSHGNATLRP